MADIAGHRLNDSASPAVASDSAQSGPLPSPGVSRRNSHSDQNAAQSVPWNGSIKPPSTQVASSSVLPGTTPAPNQYRHYVPSWESSNVGSGHQQMRTPPAPAAHQQPLSNLAHPFGQHLPGQPPPNTRSVYPSPRADATQLCVTSQYGDLMQLINNTDPRIVRQVIRDSHEPCLLGSEYHFKFLFNTIIHKAKTSTLNEVITDFGSRLVNTSKHQIAPHFNTDDIDEVTDIILSKASNDFLDRALAKRLETIRARSLVNALAKAERLGYDVKDVVEEKRDGSEYVVPHSQEDLAQHPSQHYPSLQQPVRAGPAVPVSEKMQSVAKPSSKSHNFMCCSTCARPCSGVHALRYHKMKSACNNLKTFDRVGRDICAHCGTEFTSSGGLGYHAKSQVCGNYTDQHVLDIMPVLRDFYRGLPPPGSLPQSHKASSLPMAPVATVTAISTGKGKIQDPYGHLLPEDRKLLADDLADAEAHYGQLMQKALELPEPQREEELAKLKNSFNTKQSTTRKKYGVKLRERRTRAEIDAERERLLQAKHKSDQLQETHTPHSGSMPSAKKARINGEGDSASIVQPDISSIAEDSPRKRVALADMGGLGTSAATAEHTDPTAPAPPKSHMGPYQQSQPQGSASKTAAGLQKDGGPDDPMQIDESSDSEDSDSEEDDDIPATAPHKHQ